MTAFEIKNTEGAAAGTVELVDSVFGIEPNIPVMHQVVRMQRASWRAGTSNTLTRGQVSGGGKKPWRQKGTGYNYIFLVNLELLLSSISLLGGS